MFDLFVVTVVIMLVLLGVAYHFDKKSDDNFPTYEPFELPEWLPPRRRKSYIQAGWYPPRKSRRPSK